MMEPSTLVGDSALFQEHFLWLMIVGGLAAALMAYGIGANDVANAFATSVGSKSLTFKQAVLLGAICETLGASLLGAAVSDTVRKKIIDLDYFKYNPEVLMLGMVMALFASGLWLVLCSSVGLPVSTTHSIIGALIGIGLATSPESIQWSSVGFVVLSWLTSPLFSAAIGATFFVVIRKFILRHENGHMRALYFYPVLLFFLFSTVMLCLLFKIPAASVKKAAKEDPAFAIGVGLAVVAGVTIVVFLASSRSMHRRIKKAVEADRLAVLDLENTDACNDGSTESSNENGATTGIEPDFPPIEQCNSNDDSTLADAKTFKTKKTFTKWFSIQKDVHDEVEQNATVKMLHDDAEQFPIRTEEAFNFLQVTAACFHSIAHGANDVANAVGPFAAVVNIFREATVASKVEVDWWVLLAGGLMIAVGLLTYGSHVLRTIGVNLTKITPSRGFSIEMGGTWVIIAGSNIGMPLSTTHCQVGATLGVGLCESRIGAKKKDSKLQGVNLAILGKVAAGWIVTLFFTAALSMVLYSCASAAYFPRSGNVSCGQSVSDAYGGSDFDAPIYAGSNDDIKARFSAEFNRVTGNSESILSLQQLEAKGLVNAEERKWAKKWGYSEMAVEEYVLFRCATPLGTLDTPCAPRCQNREHWARAECVWTKLPSTAEKGFTVTATYQFAPCTASP
eukprot:GEMP01000915.1.p1 GENE.GEMP01000915.1~~GEMP01000915.1.p1  ORF type:complete len:719 (+),score=127.67 GEMP01000915.1:128-2158(+)